MSVRAERKLQSQQAILDQVLKLNYAGQCFNSISLRQLAQAVGMVPSAFYRYFPNKEQLAIELVDQTALIIKSHLTQFLSISSIKTVKYSKHIYRCFVVRFSKKLHIGIFLLWNVGRWKLS
jgi:AcrR family transcriptional regulator